METGLTYTSETTVGQQHLAENAGSGDLPVLATPAMIALMENAAMNAAAQQLADNESTVGSMINATHIRPTTEGCRVKATATLTAAEGRKLTFNIVAEDEKGKIGEATHERFVIDRQRFMAKARG